MSERYLVTYKTKDQAENIQSIERCIGKCGCKRTKIGKKFNNFPEIFVLEDASQTVLQALEEDSDVLAVEKDAFTPLAEYKDEQSVPAAQSVEWSHLMSGINEFHSRGYKGSGVKVGIIDTGFANHEDLVYAGRYNAYSSSVPPEADTYKGRGHGTQCAGIIGARDNSLGYLGIAPQAQIYGVKADDNSGGGIASSAQIDGINWLINQGVKIVSCSYGGESEPSSTVRRAYVNAYNNHDVLFVCAAGNEANQDVADPNDCVTYPGKHTFVMAVGCVRKDADMADYSSRGMEVDVAIGGDGVMTTQPSANNRNKTNYYEVGTTYVSFAGTSCATPHMAGVAALYKQMYPNYTADQLRNIIQTNVIQHGAESKNRAYGRGIVVSPWTTKTNRFFSFTGKRITRTTTQYRGDFHKFTPTITGTYKTFTTGSPRISVFDSDGSMYIPDRTSFTAGQTYYIGVFKENPGQYTLSMAHSSQIPPVPTASVSSKTDTTITLQFSASGVTGYRVYGFFGNLVAEVTGNTYTITGLTPGSDYNSRWYVKSINDYGESDRSAYVGAYTNPSTPSLRVGNLT